MSLSQFYLENQILEQEESEHIQLRLSAEDLRHFKVLRLKAGEHLALIDATGVYYEVEITDPNWSAPKVRICARDDSGEQGPAVVLFQGIAKGDKLDTIVRQATEVGVSGMVFVPFKRCVQTLEGKQLQNRLARFDAIAKSAAMQSGRRSIPEVTVLDGVSDMEEYLTNATAVLIFWEEATLADRFEDALSTALTAQFCPAADARVAIIIGPEGGLESEEVARIKALNKHAYSVTMGPSILRTETAGVVAPALVLNYLRGLEPLERS